MSFISMSPQILTFTLKSQIQKCCVSNCFHQTRKKKATNLQKTALLRSFPSVFQLRVSGIPIHCYVNHKNTSVRFKWQCGCMPLQYRQGLCYVLSWDATCSVLHKYSDHNCVGRCGSNVLSSSPGFLDLAVSIPGKKQYHFSHLVNMPLTCPCTSA